MSYNVTIKKRIISLITVVTLIIAAIIGVQLLNSGRSVPQPEYTRDESTSLDSIKKEVAFQIFVPTYLPNLEIVKDWYIIEFGSTMEVSIIYEPSTATDNDTDLMRINQSKVRQRDIDLVELDTGEDENFSYEEIRIGDTKGLIVIAKYDLPHKKTSYDPRRAARLALIKDSTYILLWSGNVNAFSIEELIKVAESLTPLQ